MQPTKELITVNSICTLCRTNITIIKGRSSICTNCKTNLAFIMRNYHKPARKINNMKLRIIALEKIAENPKIGVTESLRQAIRSNKDKS